MLYTINSYYDLLLIKYMSLYFYYIVTLIYLIVHIMYRIAFEINYSILFYSILYMKHKYVKIYVYVRVWEFLDGSGPMG